MSEYRDSERIEDRQLEALLRSYASSPEPDGRFVERLERKLEAQEAAQSTAPHSQQVGADGSIFGWLAAWWHRSARPRQSVWTVASAAVAIMLLVAAAGLFLSWLGGIRQIADDPTAPAIGPISTSRPESPTPPGGTRALSGVPPVTPTPPKASDFPHHQNAVYVAPTDDGPVPHAEFTRLGIDVLPGVANLRAHLQSEPLEIVYLSPAAFEEITHDDLLQLYDGGLLVVFLDVPVSEINEKLPVFAASEDLPAETYTGSDQFIAAAFQRQVEFEPTGGDWTYADAYHVENFWYLVHDVERRLQELDGSLPITPTLPPTPSGTPFQGSGYPMPFQTPTPFDPTAPAPVPSVSATPLDDSTVLLGSPTPPRVEEIVPQTLLQHLMQEDVAPEGVTVAAYQPLPYPDLCLGVYREGHTCTVLSLNYNQHTTDFHINSAGEFRQVSRYDTHRTATAALTWGSDDCQIAVLPTDDPTAPVQVGPCQGGYFTYPYPDPQTEAQWTTYLDTYTTFTAVTPSGFLAFHGLGDVEPTEAEREEIAAWMRAVVERVLERE